MATTVQNPFDTQQASATNTGIVGSAIQSGSPTPTPDATLTTAPANNVTTAAAPAANTVSSYAPTTRQIDQPTGTVQGQVNSILATDNPLMQRARTLATQQMAQRGLVNSSMNAGAGVAAMTDKAIQIGAQDANAYNQAASENMAATNTSGQFNANASNTAALQTGQQTFTAQQNKAQQDFTSAQTALDRAQQTALADKSVAAQQALQKAQQDFSGAQAALDRSQQTSLQTSQQTFQATQQQIQNDFAAQTQKLQESGMDFRQARDIASQEAMRKLEQEGITNRFDQELALKSSQFDVEQLKLDQRQLSQNQAELDKLGLQIKASQAQVPTQFAANIANTTMNGVNAILADGNMTAAAKQTSIANLATYANAQIAWAEKFYGTTINKITVPTLA